MDPSQSFARDVLKRVGIVKNELLAFTIIICLILNVFGIILGQHEDHGQKIVGEIMHIASILIVLGFGYVYVYALLKLPGSQQELIFTEEAKKMVAEHKRRRRKAAA